MTDLVEALLRMASVIALNETLFSICDDPFLLQFTLYRGAGRIGICRQTELTGIRRKLELTYRVMKVVGEEIDVVPIQIQFKRSDPVMVA